MMMHEDWGTTQNYAVADAGERWICQPVRYRNRKGIARGLGEFRGREADFSTALLTIRL
jgi:hypothetical protein